jgi:hypothetical protein
LTACHSSMSQQPQFNSGLATCYLDAVNRKLVRAALIVVCYNKCALIIMSRSFMFLFGTWTLLHGLATARDKRSAERHYSSNPSKNFL